MTMRFDHSSFVCDRSRDNVIMAPGIAIESRIQPVERGRHGACVVRQFSTDPLSIFYGQLVHTSRAAASEVVPRTRLLIMDEARNYCMNACC